MEKITSRNNPVCIHIKKLGKSRSYRNEHGLFVCDGSKLLDEAIGSGAKIDVILTTEELNCTLSSNTRVYNVDNKLLDSLSPLKNHQGILFTCRNSFLNDCDYRTGIHILLDNIQDPGNFGTIIRSASAFDIVSLIITEGCADLYNPKTIRASMGAIFKQRINTLKYKEIEDLKSLGVKFIGASSTDNSFDIRYTELSDAIIIVGNEGHGISGKLLDLCDKMIKIPISQGCESINAAVAASIIMWEARKS